jgi:hypothetical protein
MTPFLQNYGEDSYIQWGIILIFISSDPNYKKGTGWVEEAN